MRLKHFLSVFLTLLTLSVGQMWGADTQLYFEGWESNSHHRTSGNNDYGETAKTYGDFSFVYADAVSSGSPLTGSYHAILRHGKKCGQRTCSLTSGELLSDSYEIHTIKWNCKRGVAGQTLKVSYSTNGTSWTEGYNAELPSSKTERSISSLSITGPIYLKFEVSYNNSANSNCDANIDDITIEGVELTECEKIGAPTVTATTDDQTINLSWTDQIGASSYTVTRTPADGTVGTPSKSENTWSCAITDLTNGTAYTWTVTPVGNGTTHCADGNTAASASATPNLYHTVTWNTHNGEFTTTQVIDNTKPTFPKVNDEDPESCDDDVDKFYGWSTTSFNTTDDISEKIIYTSASDMPKVTTDNVVYYAVFTDVEAADYSTTYTSNVTGVSGVTVNIGSNSYDGKKVGSQSAGGSITVSCPIGTTAIAVHAYSWNGADNKTITPSASGITFTPTSGTLRANSGVTGSGPFTLSTANWNNNYFLFEFDKALTAATNVTLTLNNRGIFWGINAVSGNSEDAHYLTNCCTKLGQINGSVSLSQLDTPDPKRLKASWSWGDNPDMTGIDHSIIKIYNASNDGLAHTSGNIANNVTTYEVPANALTPCTEYYATITTIKDNNATTYCDGVEHGKSVTNVSTIGYTYTNSSTHVNLVADLPASTCANGGADVDIQFTAAAGYRLPTTDEEIEANVSVTNAGEKDEDWFCSVANNVLTISLSPSKATGTIDIKVDGIVTIVPEITVSTNKIDFDEVKKDAPTSTTFTVEGAHLSNNITLSSDEEAFTLSSYSLTQEEGSVALTTITLTANTSTAGDYAGTITISDGNDGATDKSIDVYLTVLETYTVNFYINSITTPAVDAQTDVQGTALVVPTVNVASISDCADANYVFKGWTNTSSYTHGTSDLITNTAGLAIGNADANYYAVFALKEGEDGYAKVTAVNQLTAGDKIVITGYKNSTTTYYGMKAYDSGNNCGQAEISIENDKITSLGDACELTLGGTTNAWTFYDGTYYIYAAGAAASKQNYMKGKETSDDECLWSIAIENGETSVTSNENTYVPHMQYNNSNGLFSCYNTASQSPVTLYKKESATYSNYRLVCPHAYIVDLSPATNGNGTISFAKNASAITEIETTGENDVTVDVVAVPATGYELSGVALSGIGGASYSAGVITLPANTEGTLTATATFSKADYAVTYTTPSNGNYTIKVGDAAAVSENTTAQHEQTITLAVASVTEGYQFIGWTVTKTVGGEAIAVDGNNQFIMPAEAVTIAATFQEIPAVAYTVTFSQGDHGTCTESSLEEESAGAGVTLPSCTAATGYAFLGWTATENKTSVDEGLTAGALYRPEDNITLYAVYKQLKAVTLMKRDNSDTDVVLYEDVATGKVELPARTCKNNDYTFAGWSTTYYSTEQEDADAVIFVAGEYTPMGNITLYPVFSRSSESYVWTKITDLSTVTEGTYALVSTDNYAFNGTISSGHGQKTSTAFEFTEGVAEEAPDGTCILEFQAVTEEEVVVGYKMYNETNGYLYASAASSGKLAWHNEEESYWKEGNGDWLYNANSAHLRVYDNTFRTYSGSNNNALAMAKKTTVLHSLYLAAPANDVAAPTFLPAAGAYYGAQNVEISCATQDVTIYYTDGESDPTDQSTVYSTAISVSNSKTIKAIAIDEDGYSSAVAEAAYTINPIYNSIAAYQAASAQEAATARVLIDKNNADAIVIGVVGAYSYIQDGTAAMVIKRPNNENQWTVGSELNGSVQGTRSTYYGLPMITVEDIADVETSTGSLPDVQPISNLDFASAWSSYAGNLIKVEDVYFQAQATSSDKVDLQDGAEHSGKLYDAIHFLGYAALPLTETACDITGILVAKTENEVTTYYIAPTSTADISTKGALAQLTVNPIGGADADHAAGIAPGGQVTITPVDGFATTLGGEEITTVSTVDVTGPTSITVSASRQFYAVNNKEYFYDVDNTYKPVVVTQPTDVGGSTISASPTSAQEGNTITLSYNLLGHYHFKAWNVYKTGESGTTVKVTNNQFTMPEYAVTVEAVLEEDAYATILFADGGATSGAVPTDANKYYVGDEVTMPGKNTLAKSGNTFAGWRIGGYDYVENAKYTIAEADAAIGGNEITFTAQWTPYPWGGNGKWELVTDASEITVSPATYVIFADTKQSGNKACGETQNTNNRAIVDVSISDGLLTWTGSSPAVFTIETGNEADTYAFYDAINGGYLNASGSGNKNYLTTTVSKASANASFEIESIDAETGAATVKAKSENRNLLNVNHSNSCFSAYGSEIDGLAIYKFVAGSYFNINYAVGDVDEPEEVSNMPATQVTANDGTATLSSEVPVYVGKLFQNWKDEEDQTYEPGANVALTKNVTLTAQWGEAPKYALSYDLNGGTVKEGSAAVPDPAEYYPYQEATVASSLLEKENVIFLGWEYDGTVYAPGASFTMPNEAATLKAKFAKGAIYTITSKTEVEDLGAPDGSSAVYTQTFATASQATANNSMTLTLSGYKGYQIKNITLSMHANNNSGAGTFSATVGSQSVASIATATTFNKWYDNTTYGTGYRDVHVAMTSYPAVGATDDIVITIAATANSLYCQSFTIEYAVAPIEINDEESVDASDILPGADITINNGGELVINEEKELNNIIVNKGATVTVSKPLAANDVTVKAGATVTVSEEVQANDMTVEVGGTITGTDNVSVRNLVIKTKLGTIVDAEASNDIPGASGQIETTGEISAANDAVIEIELTQETQASWGWYAFSVPFPVDALNGVYFGDKKLTNEVDYAIMKYHEDKRAAGEYAWKKYREILQPGVLYFITVGDTDYKTLRFKKVSGEAIVASNAVSVSKTAASGEGASGWNGIGNPNLQVSHFGGTMQFFDHAARCFRVRTSDLMVGSAFMYQHTGDDQSVVVETGSASLAPARVESSIEKTTFEVLLRNVATGRAEDNVFLRTSETALSTYEIGRDLGKIEMGTCTDAQMYIPAYGTKLCIADFPMVNGQVAYPLTITAPAAGTYNLSAKASDKADIYLTQEGAIIWNLSMSEYELDLTKGTTNGYGLLLVEKAPGIATGVDEISGEKAGVQKIVIEDKVFILRGGKMYDVTGKAVK